MGQVGILVEGVLKRHIGREDNFARPEEGVAEGLPWASVGGILVNQGDRGDKPVGQRRQHTAGFDAVDQCELEIEVLAHATDGGMRQDRVCPHSWRGDDRHAGAPERIGKATRRPGEASQRCTASECLDKIEAKHRRARP